MCPLRKTLTQHVQGFLCCTLANTLAKNKCVYGCCSDDRAGQLMYFLCILSLSVVASAFAEGHGSQVGDRDHEEGQGDTR